MEPKKYRGYRLLLQIEFASVEDYLTHEVGESNAHNNCGQASSNETLPGLFWTQLSKSRSWRILSLAIVIGWFLLGLLIFFVLGIPTSCWQKCPFSRAKKWHFGCRYKKTETTFQRQYPPKMVKDTFVLGVSQFWVGFKPILKFCFFLPFFPF